METNNSGWVIPIKVTAGERVSKPTRAHGKGSSKTTRSYAKCVVSNNHLKRKNERQGIKRKEGNAIKTGGNIIPLEKKKEKREKNNKGKHEIAQAKWNVARRDKESHQRTKYEVISPWRGITKPRQAIK